MPVASPTRTFRHPQQNDTATFLETAAESGGARTLLQVELGPAGSNAAHRHTTYAEHFEVVEGTLTVHLGDAERRLGPGETAAVPAGVLHRFANDTCEAVTFRVELHPGHLGFERALMAGYGLAADGLVSRRGIPLNPYHLAILLEWSEMAIPGAAQPAVRMLARRARRKGIDARLAARYCAW
jgi:quercetin dioxygenase-like cupin family protein